METKVIAVEDLSELELAFSDCGFRECGNATDSPKPGI